MKKLDLMLTSTRLNELLRIDEYRVVDNRVEFEFVETRYSDDLELDELNQDQHGFRVVVYQTGSFELDLISSDNNVIDSIETRLDKVEVDWVLNQFEVNKQEIEKLITNSYKKLSFARGLRVLCTQIEN